jgi:hypothetical protein
VRLQVMKSATRRKIDDTQSGQGSRLLDASVMVTIPAGGDCESGICKDGLPQEGGKRSSATGLP